ncbi:MAG: hypothetical protein ACJ75B_08295 [Flavisolibacter sp.]
MHLGSFSLFAQTITLRSNDTSIHYESIPPIHYFTKVSVCDTFGNIQFEFLNENLRTVDTLHRILFARFRSIPFGKIYTDSSWTSAEGPISLTETTTQLTKHLVVNFGKTRITVHVFNKNVLSDSVVTMEEGYFDDNIIEDLVGYLPIKKDVQYHLDCYRYESRGGKNPYDLHFVFDDLLSRTSGKPIACSVLFFRNSYQHGYCWIDRNSRVNIKQIIYQKDRLILVQVI